MKKLIVLVVTVLFGYTGMAQSLKIYSSYITSQVDTVMLARKSEIVESRYYKDFTFDLKAGEMLSVNIIPLGSDNGEVQVLKGSQVLKSFNTADNPEKGKIRLSHTATNDSTVTIRFLGIAKKQPFSATVVFNIASALLKPGNPDDNLCEMLSYLNATHQNDFAFFIDSFDRQEGTTKYFKTTQQYGAQTTLSWNESAGYTLVIDLIKSANQVTADEAYMKYYSQYKDCLKGVEKTVEKNVTETINGRDHLHRAWIQNGKVVNGYMMLSEFKDSNGEFGVQLLIADKAQ